MELNNLKVNFLGDSITYGHGLSSSKKRFTNLIAKEYGIIPRNYGISGTRIAKQINPSIKPVWDKDFISRVAEMDEDADLVVVFGGTNDFGHGDAPLGTMEDRNAYTFYGALHTLYTDLINKYPTSKIVVITPLHRTDENAKGIKTDFEASLIDYVEIIRQVAEYYSLPVLDLYKTSGLQPNISVIKEKYIPDGLHPNEEGHKILAEKIAKFLIGL